MKTRVFIKANTIKVTPISWYFVAVRESNFYAQLASAGKALSCENKLRE